MSQTKTKILFLTSEISPFCETYKLSDFSKKISMLLNDKENYDIRISQPKYGFISERKYILREVIRLREINTKIGEGFEVASAKSAFIPKTRVQVYFMEHENFFQPLSPLLYKAKNGRPLPDNGERFGFFSKMLHVTSKNPSSLLIPVPIKYEGLPSSSLSFK